MPLKPPVLAGFPHHPPAEEKEGTASLLAGGDRSLGPTVLWRHGSSVWVGLSAAGAGAVASLCLVSQLPGRCVWVPRNGAGRPYTELVSELGVSSDHQGLRIQRWRRLFWSGWWRGGYRFSLEYRGWGSKVLFFCTDFPVLRPERAAWIWGSFCSFPLVFSCVWPLLSNSS